MTPKRPEYLKGTLLILAFVGICAQIPIAAQKYLTPHEAISSQVADDLESSVEVNAHAKTAQEWESSGYTPADVFTGIRALKSPVAWKTACKVLMKMKGSDLALFEPELRSGVNAHNLPCHSQLSDHLRNYWAGSRAAMASAYPESYMSHSAVAKGSRPSTEKRLDAHMNAAGAESKDLMKDGEITLLFDGGPEGENDRTSRVLNALKDEGVRAMFVVEGSRARQNTAMVGRLAAAGHIVGATSFKKSVLTLLDTKTAEEQINEGRNTVSRVLGAPARFFRFPFEASSEFLENYVDKQGVLVMAPTVDSEDWKIRDPKLLLQSVVAKLDKSHGGILELHDGSEQTVEILPALLAEIRSRSFSTVVFVPSNGISTVAQR